VEDTLGELFRSLKSIIPDVLEACNNDGTAAFEQLQQMQDDVFNAVEWFSPPLAADVVVHSLKEKIDILAEQYNELPRGVIQEYLRRNSEDLDRASTQLLMTKDSNEDQAKVEHDRVLALELSQSSPPRNQRRSQYSEPTVDVSTMPAHSDWLTNGGEAARGRVKHLHACFPSAPQSVIEKILHISKDNLDFAKDILREEGHEEVAQRLTLHPHLSSEGRQSLGSSRTNSRSPRCNDYTRVKNHQTLYEEHRAQGNAINKNIIQKVQKVEELRRENRHNDASMLEAQIPELKRQARRADQFAKESIFENMNKDNCAMREIDLHCLHRREAIEKVHQMVEYCINDPVSDTFCKVVTGWGRGSQDNVPKLRPAVEEYLDKRGITHGLEVGNSGMVCFCINRGQRLQPYMECF
jgi:DNA-nicking Smr family endonuclease